MSFTATVRQADLVAGLRFAALAIAKRAPLAVLTGVKLEAAERGLRLSGTDYETAAITVVEADAEGAALVNCADLLASVKGLPKGALVELRETPAGVTVATDGFEVTLPALALADYPTLPAAGTVPLATLDAAAVAQLPDVASAAGVDDTLPILTAVYVEADGDTVTFAATDRYRLAVQEITGACEAVRRTETLIPARMLTAAAKAFKGGAMFINVDERESLVTLDGGDRRLIVRVLDGTFPKYRSLIPAGPFAFTAEVDSAALAATVSRVAATAKRLDPVRIGFAGAYGLNVEWIGGDAGGSQALVPAICSGEPTGVAFSPKYLTEALKAAGGRVNVLGTTPLKPVLFRRDDRPGFAALVMPVRLPDA